MRLKNCFLHVCLAAAVVILSGGRDLSAWTDSDYDTFDYRGFEGLPAAGARIDMHNVDYALLNAAIFYETNRQRVLNGKSAFRHSPILEKVAAGHSRDMARRNFFSHESPVEGKKTLQDRALKEGFTLRNKVIGENIYDSFGLEYKSGTNLYVPDRARNYFRYEPNGEPIRNHTYIGLAKSAVAGWMNSPPHRQNILSDDFQSLAAGSAHYMDPQLPGMDRFKLTQNFSGKYVPAPRPPDAQARKNEQRAPLFRYSK